MSFEKKLRTFFKKHDPGREYLAPRIARRFNNDRDVVMVHLSKLYANGGVQFKGYSQAQPKLEAPAAPMLEENTVTEAEAEAAIPETEATAETHEEVAESAEVAEEATEETEAEATEELAEEEEEVKEE